MFELLFKEPLSVWREAAFTFASGWSSEALLAAVAIAAVAIVVSLWRAPLGASRRVMLGLLQLLVAAVALTMLWRPALEIERMSAGENAVAWLVDNSGSMTREDAQHGGAASSRRAAVVGALSDGGLLDDERFSPRLLVLGTESLKLDDLSTLADLPPPSLRSALATGLDGALGDVGDTAIAAAVLFSDGADNVGTIDARWWQRLVAAGIPVHTVGVGAIEDDDFELAGVEIAPEAAVGAQLGARLRIVHPRVPDAGPSVRLRVSDGDMLLLAEDIALDAEASETVHTVRFNAGTAGLKRLDFSLAAERSDDHPANDAQGRILDVRDAPRRILYVEGEPRWEYKFLRRAVADHAGLEVVSLLRTSPNKFYRQGVRDGQELVDGFPRTREALFAYDAIIVGSLAAAELDGEQQAALRDFVSVRGGALLMLAGRQGLADGGWARSGVAAALPVTLDARLSANTYRRERVRVLPTRQGLRTPWLALAGEGGDETTAWLALPEVADNQTVGTPKPGARVLLENGSGEPLLVAQRYGRGTSLVLGTGGTWRWQMGLSSEDESHERFWRSLLGELGARALPRLDLAVGPGVLRDADSTRVSVDALGADFTPLSAPTLAAQVTAPDGSTRTLELVADAATEGRYSATLPLDADGPWGVSVTTPPDGESPSGPAATVERWLLRESGTAETFGARQDRDFLERVASSTGGRYFPLADVGELPEALATDNAALTRSALLPLWNLPLFFLLLMLGKGGEWLLRLRWKRL